MDTRTKDALRTARAYLLEAWELAGDDQKIGRAIEWVDFALGKSPPKGPFSQHEFKLYSIANKNGHYLTIEQVLDLLNSP